ncbi:conserved hypothetical protein [Arthrobacter sp. Hiyo8]|nr:conserved hypothetical protein [Arthrobacter sp. Hiyo8]
MARHCPDLLILATRPWFTLAMIPLSIVAMLVITAILVTVTASAKESQNQLGLQSLVLQLPAWFVVPLLVVLGPFVEEYLFRHLLIGKLSRRVNIWLCCALSVLCFAAIHVVDERAWYFRPWPRTSEWASCWWPSTSGRART